MSFITDAERHNPSAKGAYVEPWMRGTHADLPVVGRAVLHALEIALDEITKWTAGLTDVEVESRPLGVSSVAFHLKHIVGSVDRILCYAEGRHLTAEQLTELKDELTGSESLKELLARVGVSFASAARRVRELATADLETPRGVGRQMLPTTIGGALIHVADHTMRHVGQTVTTCQLLKALRASQTP